MLSIEDNELLTRTGPGTAMGDLFRRFWLPVALSKEVGPTEKGPTKVTVLGEKLIAFRNKDNTVGLVDARCPHRLANLYWGRNEGDGLRCVYHGWKFDKEGNCLDQPAESEETCFKQHVKLKAYPTHEVAGAIWAYMGPADKKPPFPEFEFTLVPSDHVYASKRLQLCNWLQNLEGELDTAHVQQLHQHEVVPGSMVALAPRYEIKDTGFGMLMIAKREGKDGTPHAGKINWRMTPYIMPSGTLIPQTPERPQHLTFAVPIDDVTMMGYTVSWRADRPITGEDMRRFTEDDILHLRVDPETFLPVANIHNDYLIDRKSQATETMTGIPGLRLQDVAVQEDQDGPIAPRHLEKLGSTDLAIVMMRRKLLTTVKGLQNGQEPPQPSDSESFKCRSVFAEVSSDLSWQDVFKSVQPAGSKVALEA
ncbi:Rieske 2Fe-2S domain-containing protein [Pinisolibacter aquiterrae]|uniref:Rieske 2Fe-2S domain-containing protein n=1 Tax=Pinisolibacter aquiterrae TaxID=2815579 RepID=UPI001C3DA927|nr:Rieske 2Fe-2S domain-containing protein [Pinisolibacter aquiterrae]MBV5263683.1 Rieske 2Fe-2S domain-containing protein [Pinisolibacter aquiterrae]MCC8235119.1 Rieske 2Fe-2S domain-containing protein [Pinisolibacter aquiterrae]